MSGFILTLIVNGRKVSVQHFKKIETMSLHVDPAPAISFIKTKCPIEFIKYKRIPFEENDHYYSVHPTKLKEANG